MWLCHNGLLSLRLIRSAVFGPRGLVFFFLCVKVNNRKKEISGILFSSHPRSASTSIKPWRPFGHFGCGRGALSTVMMLFCCLLVCSAVAGWSRGHFGIFFFFFFLVGGGVQMGPMFRPTDFFFFFGISSTQSSYILHMFSFPSSSCRGRPTQIILISWVNLWYASLWEFHNQTIYEQVERAPYRRYN